MITGSETFFASPEAPDARALRRLHGSLVVGRSARSCHWLESVTHKLSVCLVSATSPLTHTSTSSAFAVPFVPQTARHLCTERTQHVALVPSARSKRISRSCRPERGLCVCIRAPPRGHDLRWWLATSDSAKGRAPRPCPACRRQRFASPQAFGHGAHRSPPAPLQAVMHPLPHRSAAQRAVPAIGQRMAMQPAGGRLARMQTWRQTSTWAVNISCPSCRRRCIERVVSEAASHAPLKYTHGHFNTYKSNFHADHPGAV